MTTQPEEVLVRRGLALAWFIVRWDVIEGVVAVTAGLAANSIALIGFGIDSAIEVFAASVVIWQLRGGAQTRQQLALRLIGLPFFALASYVAFESIRDLITQDKGRRVPDRHCAQRGRPDRHGACRRCTAPHRTGLDNPVLVAQSTERISNALSVTVFAGLGLNFTLGWWWADPAVALVVAAITLWNGREAWREAGEREPSTLPSTSR